MPHTFHRPFIAKRRALRRISTILFFFVTGTFFITHFAIPLLRFSPPSVFVSSIDHPRYSAQQHEHQQQEEQQQQHPLRKQEEQLLQPPVSHRITDYASLTSQDVSLDPPAPAEHDVCLLVGRDPSAPGALWRLNSRSLCVTSPICIPTSSRDPVLHSSHFERSSCRVVTPALHSLPPPFDNPANADPLFPSCADTHHAFALCPLPNVSHVKASPCLSRQPTEHVELKRTMDIARSRNLSLDGITIVVPRFPFSANIYHFSSTVTAVLQSANSLDTLIAHYGADKLRPPHSQRAAPLNVLFLTQRRKHLPWQSGMMDILVRSPALSRAVPQGLRVFYITEVDAPYICARNPILLGQRGHVNVWPFSNSTAVSWDGSAVPRDAVQFRDAVYNVVGITPRVYRRATGDDNDDNASGSDENNHEGGASKDEEGIHYMPPPPLRLTYAQREGRSTVVGQGTHAAGSVRRFSDEDEAWFYNMLRNETSAADIDLEVFTPTASASLEEQIRHVERIGFLVGIHGANLANCIFMRPLSAIFEIFPANLYSSCYLAGSNSGMAYFMYEAEVEATPQESGCAPDARRCWASTRQRMVKIGTDRDRKVIRDNVRKGIAHIVGLNRDFPSGVPVRYDHLTGNYHVVRK